MATTGQTTEQQVREKKVQIGANVDPAIQQILADFAEADDRTVSNTVERLLKTHPRVQPLLEAEPAAA